MTPLQKDILKAVGRRPMTLRELQNNLQADNARLRMSRGLPLTKTKMRPVRSTARWSSWHRGSVLRAVMMGKEIFLSPAEACTVQCRRTKSKSSSLIIRV